LRVFPVLLRSELIKGTTKAATAKQISLALKMLREEITEWGPLPFTQRKDERSNKLYSQAIVIRSILRVLRDLYEINERENTVGDWNRWRATIKKLKTEYRFEKDEHKFRGEFLSRRNPLFYALEGQSIYQMNKGAREKKELTESRGEKFAVDPLKDLTVQNTRLSLDTMYGFIRDYLGYHKRQA
jgi:hypothetical protein